MNAQSVYIQVQGNRSLRHEDQLIYDYAKSKNINTVFYTIKNIHRRNLPITLNDVVVGDINCVEGALKQLGLDVPAPNSYPKSLRKYLLRNLWEATVGELESQLRDGLEKAVFAKPAEKLKKIHWYGFSF